MALQDYNDSEEAFRDLPDAEVLSVPEMLEQFETVNVLAPLVRCSKLPFRHLASLYETHVTNTPMILAEEFSRSQAARVSDFSTSKEERGVFWMEPRHSTSSSSSSSSSSSQSNHHPEDTPKWITKHPKLPYTRLPPTPTPPTKHSRLVRGALLAQMASPNGPSLADATELISPYVDGLDINCGCPQKWAYHEGIGCALLRKPELVRDMIRCVQDRLGWNWPVSIKIRIDPDLKYVIQPDSPSIHPPLSLPPSFSTS
jgi:tRNA-dihydrouridine synthase 4